MIRHTYPVILLFSILSFLSCKKKIAVEPEPEPVIVNTPLHAGLPEHPKEINGYLYASCRTYSNISGETASYTMYATFTDPPRNIIPSFNHYFDELVFNNGSGSSAQGNISVGKLSFNNILLSPNAFNPNIIYRSTNNSPASFDYSAEWESEGNKIFKPLNTTIERGFPHLNSAKTPTAISLSAGLEINLPDVVYNYDSATVMIYINTFSQILKKTVAASKTTISFSTTELTNLLGNYNGCTIAFSVFNYSTETVENLVYVYELSNKHSRYVYVSP